MHSWIYRNRRTGWVSSCLIEVDRQVEILVGLWFQPVAACEMTEQNRRRGVLLLELAGKLPPKEA